MEIITENEESCDTAKGEEENVNAHTQTNGAKGKHHNLFALNHAIGTSASHSKRDFGKVHAL